MVGRRRWTLITFAVAVALTVVNASGAELLGGALGNTLSREPQVRPADLGAGAFDGLMNPNPAEGVDLVDAPASNNQGTAQLSHPLSIPAGRGGFQPDLSVDYDSSGGSSWVGTGWDLSFGDVTVDTEWGVPRYLADKESETYLLDGARLSPTAVRSNLQPRVSERHDFAPRVDTSYEHIVRHGDNPTNYWWEVTDKLGGKRWYGGVPDCGGPDGWERGRGQNTEPSAALQRDPSAILADADGNGFRWALSAQRDVGGNLIRYFYDRVTTHPWGASGPSGTQLYISKIRYTGWATGDCTAADIPDFEPGPPEDEAYEIRFLREAQVTPAPTPRKDIIVDAKGGFLQVTADLLRRVAVYHGIPTSTDVVFRSSRTAYTELVRRYDFHYIEGAFGKSLLSSIDQVGSNEQVYATNRFDYFDDVRTNGTYNGFAEQQPPWDSGADGLTKNLITDVGSSVLGSAESNSGDVHAYIGFNPLDPTKEGSFGGALTIKGGATEATSEFIDLNGDQLPDKVFRKTRGGPVQYRLNTSGPDDGVAKFDSQVHDVTNLSKLSTEFNIGIAGGVEAYPVASIQFSLAGDVTVGEDYFTDVNNDGLADFVSAGTVNFNHLEHVGNDLIPTFTTDSAQTDVPVDDGTANLPAIQALADVEAQNRSQSPLLDTVRRWVAPFAGVVSIDAPITFDPPPDTRTPPPAYDGDGVRATIQRGANELWSAALVTPGTTATPSGVSAVNVAAGQAIYFRLQSIDNGFRDQVRWSPQVTYTSYTHTADTPVADVNALSQKVFDSADDFTLAGRPGTKVLMPLEGVAHFDTTLHKTRATTDDVKVLVLKNGVPVISQVIAAATVNAAGIPISADIPIAAPSGSNADQIEVRLAVDSPIDITALSWTPRLYYTSATSGGQPVPVKDKDGKNTLELIVPADTEIYPQNTLDAPSKPWHSDLGRDVNAHASIDALGRQAGGRVTLTVKQRGVLVGKTQLDVPAGILSSATGDLGVTLHDNEDYWFDLTVHDNPCTAASGSGCHQLSDRITASSVQLQWHDGTDKTRDVPSTRHWAGSQAYFPISYRGWGYAGYKAEGNRASAAIDETDFDIDPNDFPTTSPTGPNDPNYHSPADANAAAFTPYQLQLRNAQDQVTGTVPVWRGVKDNIVGGADFARASRRGVDDPSVAGATAGSGVRAVRQVSVSAPVVSLAGGLVVNAAFAAGPSFGLLDYTDMNGDGFPDIVAPGYISYTGPRGGYTNEGSGVGVVGQDVTFSVGVGFGGSPLEISANSKGDANTAQNTRASSARPSASGAASAASAGDDASPDEYGVSIGGSFGITAAFTNPVTSPSSTPSSITTAPLEQELADVNGDGLPDRVIADPGGIRVKFNLGYGFTGEADFSGGGFEAGESYSGSIGGTLGFSMPDKSFSAGLAYNETDTIPRYSWVDVDGDGVLDRLRRDGSEIKVAFGTGVGIMDEVTYGTFADGNIQLVGQNIPIGQQIAQDRSVGLGGGFDFTIGIGPLCLVACYLIVNPGVHFDHSISNSTVQMEDVDGDGYPDSVRSDTDNELKVRLNRRGKTNLLKTVHNPLGGKISLDYRRDGNTVDQPNSEWVLKSEVVDDGRPGDGADTSLTTFDYSGGRFDRLERESLGYSKVTERQRKFTDDGNVDDDPLLRSIEHNFLNSTIFDSGLESSQRLIAPGNIVLHETLTDWDLFDLGTGQPANTGQSGGGTAGVARLQLAVGPLARSIEQRWYDDAGVLGEQTKNTYAYLPPVAGSPTTEPWRDLGRGNVTRQVDGGQTETTDDDVTADITYTQCRTRTDPPLGVDYTWVSVPDTLRVTDSHGNVLRSSDARKHNMVDYDGSGTADDDDDPGTLCDNQSITRLDQGIDGDLLTASSSADRDTARCHELTSGPACATTELSYDEWGSYGDIRYPANAAGERLGVKYVYDFDRHSDIASTIDSHGLESKATYDGRTGRITSRTDENGQTTSYTYDPFGRISSITGPYEQGSGHATVTFDYHLGAPYAYAVAHHFDVFHPDDTIDKAAFVDGIGRTTQTQQDASIFNGANAASAPRLVVSGAEEYDALGRTINRWYPFAVAPGQLGTFETRAANPPAVAAATATDWNLRDQITKVTAPNGAVTQTAYGFGGQNDFGARLFTRTETDALGKSERVFVDARSNVIASDDVPVGAPVHRTRYDYDPLSQLSTVTDTGANVSRYSYDLLGRRTSGQTPDGGLVETRYDASSNITSKVTPNLRAVGKQIAYTYDFERLTGIHYSDGTPDVTYTYGTDADTPTNGAGRVVGVLDGVRSQTLTYDPLGQVAVDHSTMLVHNLNDNTEARATFETAFTYDGFGRLRTMTYPDGEALTYGYDSGGLLSSLDGVKDGQPYRYLDRREYDEFFDRRFQKVGNDTQTTYEYDPQTRFLARQLTDAPARKVQDFDYTYDLVGNVMRVANRVPVPSGGLKGGPSTQNYTYDPYYRLLNADGTYTFPPGKQRNFTYSVTYDINSNIASKAQTDIIAQPGGKGTTQKPTTYTLSPAYSASKPHEITRIGTRPYTYDANGNFTGWTEDRGGQNRSATWDAENRMTSVADQGATTRFKYDQSGERGISRGPGGELAFVNRWYTVHNGSVTWKEIWAGEDRLATQRVFTDGTREFMRYFLHKDLQGSTNIVTDDTGQVFQHIEYFPSGEIWIEEHSDVHRTPYLYDGGYFDEWRNLINMGARWYEPREQFMYSPDPVLETDPAQLIDDPALSPAYSYAESNPLRLVDADGRRPSAARQALSNAFGRAANSFKQWGRIQPGSAASRRLVGGWGARLAGITPRTTDRLRTIGQRFAGISERDGVTSEFEVPAFVSISLNKTASGWKVEKVEVLGKTAFKGTNGAGAPASPAPAPAPAVASPAAPVAPAAPAAQTRAPKPLPKPPVARRTPPKAP